MNHCLANIMDWGCFWLRSQTWKSLHSYGDQICSGSTMPCQGGLLSPKAVPGGPVPTWGSVGLLCPPWTASCPQISNQPGKPLPASLELQQQTCATEQISAANAWLLKLTSGGRKYYISFWLPQLLLTAEVEEKPSVTPLQMLAP